MNNIREAFPDFEKPSVAIDTVILRVKDTAENYTETVPRKQLQVLLVKKPDEKQWHLPGTILRLGETSKDALRRVLDNNDTVNNIKFEQLYTIVDDPTRDERGHIISIVYIGITTPDIDINVDNRYEYQWVWVTKHNKITKSDRKYIDANLNELGILMYDHDVIINDTIDRLKGKLMYTDIGFSFINKMFTLKELENTFNAINERDIPGFRRIIGNKVIGTGKLSDGKSFRPAELYTRKE